MSLKGKKGFCFVALKHHSRFLLPITRALEAEGADLRYLTAPAEFPFELTLMDEGLPYCHPGSYLDAEVAEETEAAYRQVRGAWKEHVLGSSVLHHFTLPVQDKVLRMHVENFYLFRRVFAVERPDFVLALHELNSWGKMLGYLSHEYGVPFLTLQEGLYYAPAAIYRFHTEYSTACLVWGEATREVLTRSGGCANKIFVVGNTHLAEAIADATRPEAVHETQQELHLEPGKKVVTVLMGGLGYQEQFTFPAEFVTWAREVQDLTVICKWHPVTNKTVIEKIQAAFSGSPNVRLLQQYDTYRLLAVSDLCVVFGNSTTGLEALAFGKPLIEVQLAGLDYSFSAMGVAELVADLAAVPAVARQLLGNGLPPGREEKIKGYLSRNLSSTLDGGSVGRAVEVLNTMLSAQDDHRRRRQSLTTLSSAPSRPSPLENGRANGKGMPLPHLRNGAAASAKVTPNVIEEYLCSIIIPLAESRGVEETIIGIATHTPPDLSYECILSSARPEETRRLCTAIGGDVRLVPAAFRGIAHLCNAAAREAKGRYLCFLPPGTVPQPGWLDALLAEVQAEREGNAPPQSRTGIVGGKVVQANGLLTHAGIAFDANCSPSFLYRLLPPTLPGANKVRIVQAVTGCLLVPRKVFLALGEMDEGYQHAYHDIDLCLQAELAGWRTKYTPHSVCLTLGRETEEDAADRLRFYSKWVGRLWPSENEYWQEDGLDNKTLQRLYQN